MIWRFTNHVQYNTYVQYMIHYIIQIKPKTYCIYSTCTHIYIYIYYTVHIHYHIYICIIYNIYYVISLIIHEGKTKEISVCM